MKKKYICPDFILVNVDAAGIFAGSGGVTGGSPVGNTTPTDDDENNIYSNSYRNNLWN